MSKQLYDYQALSVEQLREAFKKVDKVCFTLPTGGGKTVIFSYIAEQTALRKKNVLVIAHRDFLLGQISKSLADNAVYHDLICQPSLRSILYLDHLRDFGNLFLKNNAHVTVASIATLIRRDYKKLLENIDLIIIDEAHRSCANSYVQLLNARKKGCKVLGVSATPERSDGQGLKIIYDDLVQGISVTELIKKQKLCYPIVYAPKTKLDLSGIRTTKGDYDQEQLYERIKNNTSLVGDAISHYKNITGIVPAMGFCVNVRHAEVTAEQFRAAGIKAIALSAKNSTKERNDATEALKKGELNVIFSCDLFNEGYDVGSVAAGIMLRPTKSIIINKQQIGRVLRRYPDNFNAPNLEKFIKPNGDHIAYIFDHAGNTLRFGLPTDNTNWSLEGKKNRKKNKDNEVKVTQCPNCYTYHHSGKKVCPNCGHNYFLHKTETELPETEDGELIVANQYTPEWSKGIDIKSAPLNKTLMVARTDEQLEAVAKARGYSRGWINHVKSARKKKYDRE